MQDLHKLKQLEVVLESLRNTPKSKQELINRLIENDLISSKTTDEAAEKVVQRLVRSLKDEGAIIKGGRQDNVYRYRLEKRDFVLLKEQKEIVNEEEIIAPMIASQLASMILPESMKSWVENNINKTILNKTASILDTALVESISFTGKAKFKVDSEVFKNVFDGWLHRKVISFDYPNKCGELERRSADPYLLIYHNHAWYLKSIDCNKHEQRNFALHRMENVLVTNSRFEVDYTILKNMMREPGFNEKFTKTKVWCSHKKARYVHERAKVKGQKIIQHDDGSVTFTITDETERDIINWILSEGGDAKIIEPEELRQKVIEKATAVLSCY